MYHIDMIILVGFVTAKMGGNNGTNLQLQLPPSTLLGQSGFYVAILPVGRNRQKLVVTLPLKPPCRNSNIKEPPGCTSPAASRDGGHKRGSHRPGCLSRPDFFSYAAIASFIPWTMKAPLTKQTKRTYLLASMCRHEPYYCSRCTSNRRSEESAISFACVQEQKRGLHLAQFLNRPLCISLLIV